MRKKPLEITKRPSRRHLALELLERRDLLAIMLDGVPSSEYEAFAADPMFDSVGFFYLNMADGWHRGGSAVLIAPDWLLTAGHNLFGSDGAGGGIAELRFYTGDSLLQGYDHEVNADQWYIYPGYSPDSGVGQGVDLGLVHLSEAIVDIAPAVLFSGEDQRDTLMYMAGYGQPGTPNTGLQPFDGVQRAGSNIAEGFGGDDVLTDTVESQYWTSSFSRYDLNLQPLEWMTSPGDSGSGWFTDIGGQMQLVGVTSGYLDEFGAGFSLATRTSLYNDWIATTIGAASPLGVTVETAATQVPLTNTAPLHFTATFAAAVTDFDASDVLASGAPGTLTALVTPIGTEGTTYDIAVSGMTGSGQVVIGIPEGAAHSAGGRANNASTALDPGVTYDVTAPALSVSDLLTNDATPVLTVTAADENNVAAVTFSAAGQTFGALPGTGDAWSAEVPAALPDGTHTLSVTVLDCAGNTTVDTANITVDTASPAVTAAALVTNDNTPTLTGTVIDGSPSSGLGAVTVTVGGSAHAAAVSGTTWTLALSSALADGSYSVNVSATDLAGNTGTQNFAGALVIDTVVPTVSAANVLTKDSTPLLTGTLGDASPSSGVQSVIVTAAGQTAPAVLNADGTWQVELPGVVADGAYTVTAAVTDNAGNTRSATSSLVVDSVAPVVTVNGLTTSDTTPLLTGTVSDASPSSGVTGVTVVVGGQTIPAVITNGAWSAQVSSPLGEGTYDVIATAADAAGNTASDGTTNELVVQQEAPAAAINPLVTNDRRPVLSGTVSANAKSLTVTVANRTYAAKITGTSWSANVTRTLSDGSYEVKLTVRDAQGAVTNVVVPNALTVDTRRPAGVVTPVVTNSSVPIITGRAGDTLSGVASVVVSAAGQSTTAVLSPDGTWSAVLPNPVSQGLYNVTLVVTDAAGNAAKTTARRVLTVDQTPPTAAVNRLATKDNTPLLSGTLRDASPSGGITGANVVVGGSTYSAVLKGSKWTAQVSSALPDGVYDVQVIVVDKAGNTGMDGADLAVCNWYGIFGRER